ncbi:carbon-nitrogen hydrolase [Helicobacter winghamensis]|uniref:Carbon-nitrogen hydrolase n=1 Tax=Helicobacter winghamensis TaxID=157268 RepID=A0A2N3PI53_9HELI|nr:carbon-nitrogen hydrolase [Helicobacter winghamensis]EEO26105.1 hydrolase, carbon-nitrogen family [Helicobacter winghamensis ATCC BAA-430]PKT75753.1 carbon-nitrogen hydrolase [Helicobacter winghamensis]PKT75962.1 carbon-nitrogen hydrolase [Helicobacter winghamensis]PKT76199.1 carbon-nitrogen hydrolase [Helicobacter winghamensis]PKT80345.1 carbon-nitrogen hydrolase [Helicobacter winghamensis]
MIKVALVQHAYKENKAKTQDFTAQKVKEAAALGAKLVLLQELHSGEYFCQSENVEFFDYALEFEKDCVYFSKVAKECGVVLVTSLFERRSAGLYHNTAVVFENDGSIAGKYRKMHIPDDPGFYEKFYFAPGDLGFEPILTSLGKLGVLVCWDQWYPEAARIMALKGAEILIYPTAIGWFDVDSKEEKERQRKAWIAVQRGHSVANGIPVVAINRVGFERDSSGVIDGIRFWGSSFAYGAQGELLALGSVEKEEILYFEWDKKRSEDVRRIWPFLRDRRIDAYGDILKRYCD